MSMCVGQPTWHGGMQYALWSERMYSRFCLRMLKRPSLVAVIFMPASVGRWQLGIGRS